LASFDVKAAGEPMKVETLNIKITSSDSNVGSVRNGMLFVNGAQIGSTADISSSSAGTQFNLGSSLVVYPGTPVVLEIKGDIYDNNGSNDMSNGDTLTASLVAGSQNVQKLVSLVYTGSSAQSGNQITVSQGALSLSKSSALANKTVVIPQTAYKLGSYVLSANSTEDINLNTLTLNFSPAGVASTSAISVLSDVYVVYGSSITSVKSSVVAGDNTYSINKVLTSGSSMNIDVYGTIGSAAASNDIFATKLIVSGQTVSSGKSIDTGTAVVGQTVAVTSGILQASKDASTPVTDLIAVGTGVTAKIASYKFEAQNDDYTITDLAIAIPLASANNVSGISLKNGSTVLKDFQAVDSTGVSSSSINFVIPANSSRILDVYAVLNQIGSNYATTSSKIQATLTYFKKQSSTGVQTESTSTSGANITANALYVFKSKPIVNVVALPSTSLGGGITTGQSLARFSIAADAAGSISWDVIKIGVNLSVSGKADITNLKLVNDATGIAVDGSFIGAATTTLGASSTSANVTLAFVPTAEETIGVGTPITYSLKGDVRTYGTLQSGDSITTSITSTGTRAGSAIASAFASNFSFWYSYTSST
jgi:hypothetical protein